MGRLASHGGLEFQDCPLGRDHDDAVNTKHRNLPPSVHGVCAVGTHRFALPSLNSTMKLMDGAPSSCAAQPAMPAAMFVCCNTSLPGASCTAAATALKAAPVSPVCSAMGMEAVRWPRRMLVKTSAEQLLDPLQKPTFLDLSPGFLTGGP